MEWRFPLFIAIALTAIHACSAIRLPSTKFTFPSLRARNPPTWPSSYSVSYVFSLPYTAEVQPNVVNYTVSFWRDATDGNNPRMRMDSLDGANVLIASNAAEYELVPRLDKQVCRITNDIAPGEGSNHLTALPDISGWHYNGGAFINGEQAEVWQYQRRHESKSVEYTFYSTADTGIPLRLHMHGTELFTGAHFDEWVVDYIDFSPDVPDASVFDMPDTCSASDSSSSSPFINAHSHKGASARARLMVPMVHYGGEDEAYDAFLTSEHGKGRRHANLKEYRHRLDLFRGNMNKINAHNARNDKTYTMEMNRFGDWTREEFLSVMLPKHKRENKEQEEENEKKLKKHELPYEPLIDDVRKLPSAVDWRNTGADTGVKDQANCGSCWVFGAGGALEAAWFLATGQSQSFSEQQMMDCSWGYNPKDEDSAAACDGGDAWAAVGHVVEAGGIARTQDYQYLGQDDYCREDEKREAIGGSSGGGGKFKGYVRIPSGNDTALMEAVYSRGPLAVSMDASQDSLTFYSSGVYYESDCMWKPKDLDHSMVLVGYGTDPAGDYWLVKNSWSAHWGDGGYIKFSRDNHGCGASTDALYAVVDDDVAMQL